MDNGNPCFNCPHRTPTCHRKEECKSTPTYEEWRIEHERKREEMREHQRKQHIADDYFIEQAIRHRKTVARMKKMDSYERGKKR